MTSEGNVARALRTMPGKGATSKQSQRLHIVLWKDMTLPLDHGCLIPPEDFVGLDAIS